MISPMYAKAIAALFMRAYDLGEGEFGGTSISSACCTIADMQNTYIYEIIKHLPAKYARNLSNFRSTDVVGIEYRINYYGGRENSGTIKISNPTPQDIIIILRDINTRLEENRESNTIKSGV